MHLLLRRSQRDDGGWVSSSVNFLLDVRLELDAAEQELFERYQLYDLVAYDSNDRVQQLHSALEEYEAAQEPMTPLPWVPSVWELTRAFYEIGQSVWHISAGMSHEVTAALSLQITLGTLTRGQHLESESLEEILNVAANIKASVEYLGTYLDIAVTFDGREDLIEY